MQENAVVGPSRRNAIPFEADDVLVKVELVKMVVSEGEEERMAGVCTVCVMFVKVQQERVMEETEVKDE